MNVCGIGLILLFVMINKIRHQWGKFVSLEKKNKKQFGIITLQQHVHRFTALEKIFFALTAWLKSFTK